MKTMVVAAVVAVLASSVWAEPAEAAGDEKKLQKTVKVLINAIRYKKDDLAAKQLDFDAMVAGLLESEWSRLPAAEKKFFVDGMAELIRGISFKAGRDSFQYLDAITYGSAKQNGSKAMLPSTIVIDHPIKGRSELKITWALAKTGASWRVYDTVILGESTMEGIREDQIEVLLEEGGIARVKEAMSDKLAEVRG